MSRNYDIVRLESVPLAEELGEDLVVGHLAIAELRVEGHFIHTLQVVDCHGLIAGLVKLLVSKLDEAADASEELVVVDLAVVVLVEEFENSLELGGTEDMAVLAETQLELSPVEFVVLVVINSAENLAELANTMSTSSLQG
jgi:hypothetical protein